MSKPSIDQLQDRLNKLSELLGRAGELVGTAGELSEKFTTHAEFLRLVEMQNQILNLQAQITGMHGKIISDMERWHKAHGVDAWKK
jgi:hypothetical protein